MIIRFGENIVLIYCNKISNRRAHSCSVNSSMVGKILKLRITDLDLDVWIVCGESQWWLATESQEAADVELSGTLGSLVETARSLAAGQSTWVDV